MDTLKILLIQTINNNLGDPILADNDCFLIKKALGSKKASILKYKINVPDLEQLKYVDVIIFAGGIIKTATEYFWLYMSDIIEAADKYNIPVFLSAVGVEPYDDSDRAKKLKSALNLPCVKGMSIRDDIDSLMNGWITNHDIPVTESIDPAIYCPQTYNIIPATHSSNDHPLVGINISRYALFKEHGHPEYTKAFFFNFWAEVIYLLEKAGFKWALFTNGATPDEFAAREILKYIGHGELIPAPVNCSDLVENINHFDCVIGTRMHANIISYSLGIPCIGFSWNQKLRFWGMKINHPERIIELDQMTPQNTVDILVRAYKEGIDKVPDSQFDCVYLPIKKFVEEWCIPREKCTADNLPLAEKCTALSLGAIQSKNNISNSAEALEYSLENGYNVFEVNVRATSDKKLVCIYGWDIDTAKLLYGFMPEQKRLTMSFADFYSHKTYYKYSPLSFDDFLEIIKIKLSDKSYDIIIDFNVNKSDFARMASLLINKISIPELSGITFHIMIDKPEFIQVLRNIDSSINIIIRDSSADVIKKASANNITTIAVSPLQYDNIPQNEISGNGIQAFIYPCDTASSIINYSKDKNVRFIGSTTYSVNDINALIK